MGLPINFTFSGFDASYCFTSWNQFGTDLVQRLSGETDGDGTFFNDGDTTPSPDNRIYPWTPQSYSGSNPPAFMYHYVNGAWIMPNPIPTGAVMMYQGSEASIETYDGGESGAITETTGPMWQKVSALNAKFPIGPGTTANGTVIAIGGTGGEDEVTLEREHLPNITLDVALKERTNVEGAGSNKAYSVEGAAQATPLHTESLNGDVDQEAHNNLPPFVGIWFIVRTARKYYRR